MGFNMSSSVNESVNSSGIGGYVPSERDGDEVRPLREGGSKERGEGSLK
jgi:hypothetical protein